MQLKAVQSIFQKELNTLYHRDEIDSFFYLCVEAVLKAPRFILALHPNFTMTKDETSKFMEVLNGLKRNEPIQYLLGETTFLGRQFKVDQNVLIPRPETEELVRWIIKDHVEPGRKLTILDIGTGSGNIAVTLGKELHQAKIWAMDISHKALAVAKENARLHGVALITARADILTNTFNAGPFDIIVSNPPYVRESEKKDMAANVTDHEPPGALFVSDSDPLLYYKAIATFAAENLCTGGNLYLEVNQYLGEETKHLLEEQNFSEIELRKDMFGNERMIKATRTLKSTH